MTLREQIKSIGREVENFGFVENTSFPRLVDHLAVLAFYEQWPESTRTRAIRRALQCFQTPGAPWVTESEPAME